ncbi:hypothetical protein EVAR_41945_1 [Eumeta japonica]|uniref:Uncharacterized protein n=1 Tax=Eumeta variegata TaxID=151549 RepID=A0A4C1XM54_EUMVA|nr:hypothetical protein EVAR_41945_1 [Eumeta japonica]
MEFLEPTSRKSYHVKRVRQQQQYYYPRPRRRGTRGRGRARRNNRVLIGVRVAPRVPAGALSDVNKLFAVERYGSLAQTRYALFEISEIAAPLIKSDR